jgi:hypothetical protein
MTRSSASTPRRGFLSALAAGAAGFAATRWAIPIPDATASTVLAPPSDEWLSRIKGKHKQVVDCVTPNDGWGPAFALNYLDSAGQALKLTDKDFGAVAVLRHWAMPLTLNDSVWAKYKIGELIGVKDPQTGAPATRNLFSGNVPLRPGLTYEKMIADRGVILVACNLALTVLSGMGAEKIGVAKDQAKAEWEAGLLKGVALAASGVYAVNRAQEAGCTYCYGG